MEADADLRHIFVERQGKKQVKAATVGRRRSITECIVKYMAARRDGGRFKNRRCSVLAVHVSTCSRAKDAVCRQEGRRSMTHTPIL